MTSQVDLTVTCGYPDLVSAAIVQWLGDQEAKPAPGPLRRVQALINTIDRESGQDRLANPADAAPWLTANHLRDAAAPVTANDLDALVEVREALRAMVIQNAGGPPPSADQLAPLRAIAAAGAVRTVLADDGTVRLEPAGSALRERLLGVLLEVKDAQADGTWSHLKACANDECRWAFYDRSRNHGGTWCEMAACGNKLKNRDFRARRRGGDAPR
jgi:predicted RNA-binding Zn ribbon-like protein